MRLTNCTLRVSVLLIAAHSLFVGFASAKSSTDLPQSTVTLTSSANPATFGRLVTLTAYVTPSNATGFVTFYTGITVLGTRTLSSGTASLSTIALPAGTVPVRAYYAGDAGHSLAASSPLSQTVRALPIAALVPGPIDQVIAMGLSTVADFNGDGKPDLIATYGTGVAIYLGDGNGGFHSSSAFVMNYPGTIAQSLAVAVADYNRDGIPDFIIAANDTDFVSMFLGNGDGTFQPAVNYTIGGNAGSFAVTADFNGDGISDLAVAIAGGLTVLIGNGDGTFKEPINNTAFMNLNFAAVADFNGDGIPDLAISATSGTYIFVGGGDGTFAALPVYPYSALTLVVGDFNGDGTTDIALTPFTSQYSYSSSSVQILLGNGDGTVRRGASYPMVYSDWLSLGDFNGDGKLDLAVTSIGLTVYGQPNMLYELIGNGDGTFLQSGFSVALPAGYPGSMAVADFNGDGVPDLAINSPTVDVFLGTPGMTISSTHTGNFTLGQTGANYSLSVSNLGLPTTGSITVTDTLPTALTTTAIAGAGWTCTLANLTCTRGDPLNVNATFPPIILTVNVAANAAATVMNQVTLSGGGAAGAITATDPTLIFSPCDLQQTGTITIADVQLIINEALGIAPTTYTLTTNPTVTIVDVQIEINAALGITCAAN